MEKCSTCFGTLASAAAFMSERTKCILLLISAGPVSVSLSPRNQGDKIPAGGSAGGSAVGCCRLQSAAAELKLFLNARRSANQRARQGRPPANGGFSRNTRPLSGETGLRTREIVNNMCACVTGSLLALRNTFLLALDKQRRL